MYDREMAKRLQSSFWQMACRFRVVSGSFNYSTIPGTRNCPVTEILTLFPGKNPLVLLAEKRKWTPSQSAFVVEMAEQRITSIVPVLYVL